MSRILGASLRGAREKVGFTQTDVANRLGVSKAAVGQWERGVTEPSTSNLLRVCELLDLDVTTATGGLVHLREMPPAVGNVDPDDRAFNVEDRRPLEGDKASQDAPLANIFATVDGVPILRVAPVPRGMSYSNMMGKESEASLLIWNELVDICPRPPGIDIQDNVICIYMPHDRVSPRYKVGELIFLKQQQEGRIGDYMLLEKIGAIGKPHSIFAVFGRLTKNTFETLVVEESNPTKEYIVKRDDFFSSYRALLIHELFGK